MDTRLQEFLKNSGINQSCNQFVADRKELIADISSEENFIGELNYHKALSHKTRLIIYHIIQMGEATCNCALANILNLSEGSITHHIKILEKAGLIFGQKKGHFVFYHTVENLKKTLENSTLKAHGKDQE
ncbi:MAG: ArsR/SmtB family transcription factor [Promethearchaeota archaeon]